MLLYWSLVIGINLLLLPYLRTASEFTRHNRNLIRTSLFNRYCSLVSFVRVHSHCIGANAKTIIYFMFAVSQCECYIEFTSIPFVSDVAFVTTITQCERALKAIHIGRTQKRQQFLLPVQCLLFLNVKLWHIAQIVLGMLLSCFFRKNS